MEKPTEYPLDATEWTEKGTAALVDGDIVRLIDYPTVKDTGKRAVRGTYAPVLGPDGKPVHGERRSVCRVLGISPTLGHPNAPVQPGMASGFFRSVYLEVLLSEGCSAMAPGQTTSFLQHNANILKRKVMRWPFTGPNWPDTSTARDRNQVVVAFEEAAAEQRARIASWLPLRTMLEAVAKDAGRKPKEVLEEIAPNDVVVDPDATRLWCAKVWNGQTAMDEEMVVRLANVVMALAGLCDLDELLRRLRANRSDERRAA